MKRTSAIAGTNKNPFKELDDDSISSCSVSIGAVEFVSSSSEGLTVMVPTMFNNSCGSQMNS